MYIGNLNFVGFLHSFSDLFMLEVHAGMVVKQILLRKNYMQIELPMKN